MSAPFSRTFAASARLTSGLTVLMSMWNLPGEIPASNPSGPSVTAESAAALVTIVKVTSDACCHRLGRFGKLHAVVDQPLRFGARPVVAGDGVALFEQAGYHVAAHHTETDESKLRHQSLRSDFRSPLGPRGKSLPRKTNPRGPARDEPA